MIENLQHEHDINQLKSDVDGIRNSLIGLNGSTGMINQINSLFEEISKINTNLNVISMSIAELHSINSTNNYVFSTKTELNSTEDKILAKLEELKRTSNGDRAVREKDSEDRKRYIETMKTSRWMIFASVLGIIVSAIISYV